MKILNKSIFWSLYFYVATILTQYGFNSYFGIPGNLIEPSIRDNIIFFYSLFKGLFYALIHMSIFSWFILLLPIFGFVILMFSSVRIPNFVVKLVLFLLVFSSPFYFYRLGQEIAKNKTEFPVFINECFSKKDNTIYITPAFYQTSAIVIPVSNDNNHKISGSFFLKEPTGPECEIQTKEIGKLQK